MAAARTAAVSLPILRTKNLSLISESRRRFARGFIQERDSSSSSSNNSIPLLQELLKAPVSKIKATLNSEFTPEPPEFPWATLLSSLHASAPQKANLVIEWKLEKLAKENSKNHDSYTQLMSLCEKIRNLPFAMFIFSSMEAQGVKPSSSVFNALISTSLSSNSLLTALSLFEIMESSEGYKPDSDTYNSFISAYANWGNKSSAEGWFLAKRASGLPLDAQNYSSLIFCCVKSGDFENAEKYYKEMVLAGVIPNESIFRNMILMYCQQRNSDMVKEFSKGIVNGGWKIDLNLVKKVVRLYQELGLIEGLEELLESNQDLEILALVHSSIIRIYAEKDRLDDVEYSLGRMMKNGASFSCAEDVEKVICCYFRREAYDRLDMFLECIKDSYKLTRSNYELLSAGYRRAGLLERLNFLLDEMKSDGFA